MDLDPDKVTNNMEEAQLQAKMMQQMQAPLEQAQAPAGADPNDPTGAGGGTIGTGQAPIPGEQGFTGNEQGNIEQPQASGQPPVAPQ